MTFTKFDLEKIKNKILISSELEKKFKLVKKGKDFWCCCPFHKEKTPSFKINDDIGSFYCFGCGVKGDIFTIYTDLYNYNFQDAVQELAEKSGIKINLSNKKIDSEITILKKILVAANDWFINNLDLEDGKACLKYLKSRKLTDTTIKNFKLGYSFNSKSSLLNHLKKLSFSEKDIIKSNVVKIDKNKKIKDYFYKRLIFPIFDERSNIVGFGGRSLDNTNPKYINSPESIFFQKRYLLYNLSEAKLTARKKNNLLICEGYMDVISLFQNGIKSVVAPLGTAITEEQLNLAWKFSTKPTIMFDGDKAGLAAAYKTSLMSLPIITSNKFLQFIVLPKNLDPDSFINNHSKEMLINILKKPIAFIDFIFKQSIIAFPINNADDKIVFDKYLDDLIDKIKDKKIKYFYRSEIKKLFFEKIKNQNQLNKNLITKKNTNSVLDFQLYSFVAAFINHKLIRKKIKQLLLDTKFIDNEFKKIIEEISKPEFIEKDFEDIFEGLKNNDIKKILKDSLKSNIYRLFPYSSSKFNDEEALKEIKESCVNLNTRLLNLKKINKSLSNFNENSNQLNWDELQKINKDLIKDD